MIRSAFVTSALIAVVLSPCAVGTAVAAGSSAWIAGQDKQAAAADAAPFIGDWTLTVQGSNGPGAFDLSVKVEKDKVVGEISSEQLPKQPITDVSMAEKRLVLRYSFNWEGNPVPTVVSLTPASDGKVAAQIDFAGGAYIMTGAATRREKAKQ
jgi:hypothetical protein